MHVLITTTTRRNGRSSLVCLKCRYAHCVICFAVNRWAEPLPVEIGREVIDRAFVILKNELEEQK